MADPQATREYQRVPCILLVGLTEAAAESCNRAFDPFPVVRVAHVHAALTRVPVVRPTLVVVEASYTPKEIASLLDVVTAVGARVVYASATDDAALLETVRQELAKDR